MYCNGFSCIYLNESNAKKNVCKTIVNTLKVRSGVLVDPARSTVEKARSLDTTEGS